MEATPTPVTAYVYLGGPSVRRGLRPLAFGRLLAALVPPGTRVRRHTTSEVHEQARIDAASMDDLVAAITALIRDGRITGAVEADAPRLAAAGVKRAGELGWRKARSVA